MSVTAVEIGSSSQEPKVWPSIALGYVSACLTAALVMVAYLALASIGEGGVNPAKMFLGAIWFGAGHTVFVAWQGFLVLRGLLHLLGRSDPFSFAIAGALNAYGLACILLGADTLELLWRYPPDPMFAVAGAAGGVVALLVERRLANDTHGAREGE
jgi:MFS family permease